MKCLDTYPLVEIASGNKKFTVLLDENIIIPDITIAEFYYVILQKYDPSKAEFWYKELMPYCVSINRDILIKAVKFRFQNKNKNKKRNLSFFDCVGYIYALENKIKFVTGDKEFENLENVEFIK